MTDILTSAETAELLGISTGTLAAWRHRGTSPTYTRTGHRTVRYKKSDVEKFIAERGETVPSAADLSARIETLERRVTRIERRVKK